MRSWRPFPGSLGLSRPSRPDLGEPEARVSRDTIASHDARQIEAY